MVEETNSFNTHSIRCVNCIDDVRIGPIHSPKGWSQRLSTAMFSSVRKEAVDVCKWAVQGGSCEFVEAWQYESVTDVGDHNFRSGSLNDTEILDWAINERLPGMAHQVVNGQKLLGRIRLLICERKQYNPLDFALMRNMFEQIEKKFNLHPVTLPSFESESGVHSRYLTYEYSEQDPKQLKQIAFVMKFPQKREICNWGLSLSHEVATGTTMALLHGTGARLDQPFHPYEETFRSVRHVLDSIKEAIFAWNHPMLLPCLFLTEHAKRAKQFCSYGSPIQETVSIEHELGVTKVGQSAYLVKETGAGGGIHYKYVDNPQYADKTAFAQYESARPEQLSRQQVENLIVRINTHSTKMIFTALVPEWNLACSECVVKVLDDTGPLMTGRSRGDCILREIIEYNVNLSHAVSTQVSSLQERMALQLNVLYNIVMQMDNEVVESLAVSAGRDSTSMKILAFISALFLPANFIAVLFTMDIFDWRASGKGDDRVVSKRFWVYWATALPLMAVSILGWALWWSFELWRLNRRVHELRRDDKSKLGRRVTTYDLNRSKG